VLAGACNEVFELDPTISVDPVGDVDQDGTPDDVDNCPTLANDQMNSDGDAFGNACDRCPQVSTTTTHDEDGDSVGDECDVCPGFEDLGADTDGDAVGDGCDPHPAEKDRRVVFEPFLVTPSGWLPGAVSWSVSEDTLAPDAELAADDTGMRTAITTGTGHWATVSSFFARSRWQATDRFGLVATGPTQMISCIVSCSASNCVGAQRVNGVTALGYAVLPRPSMLVAIYVQDPGSAACIFGGVNDFSPQFSAVTTSSMVISLVASPRVRATYFEHLE
jgi:hypothetical protein